MKLIRTAFLLTTGFSLGAVYTLRHSTDIVDAMYDLRDEVVKAFSEQEDPEALKTLLEHPRFAKKPDNELLCAFGDMDSEIKFTVGDLRALSVHHKTEPENYAPDLQKVREALVGMDDDVALIHSGVTDEPKLTVGDLRKLFRPTLTINDETPKESTTT